MNDAHRFWRDAFARMRFVRNVFWEGYTAQQDLACEFPMRRDGVRTIVLDVGGGVDGRWKGRKIKVSGDVPCIVLTKRWIRQSITRSLIVGSAQPTRKFPRLLYLRHLNVVMALEGPRLQRPSTLSRDTSTLPS